MAANAKTLNPVRQALISSTGTFWDTVIVCAMTGLAVVSSGLAARDDAAVLPPDAPAAVVSMVSVSAADAEAVAEEVVAVAAAPEDDAADALAVFRKHAAAAAAAPATAGRVEYWGEFEAQHLIQGAFAHIPRAGKYVLLISLIIFAYTTILGWYCYGVQAIHYLGGRIGMMIFRPLLTNTQSNVKINVLSPVGCKTLRLN